MKGNVGLLITIALTVAFVLAANIGMNKFYFKADAEKTYMAHGKSAAYEVAVVGACYVAAGFLVNMV